MTLPSAVEEVLRLRPNLDGLVDLLGALTGRSAPDSLREIEEHVATRIFFLLLGEIADAPNYDVLAARVAQRLGMGAPTTRPLVEALVHTLLNTGAAEVGRRQSVNDLPYHVRRQFYQRQGHRCAICGWSFDLPPGSDRTDYEATPTLDHVIAYRLGGDGHGNLWIVCGLCNGTKAASIHVGEFGRVWIGNHVYWSSERTAAFCAFLRDRRCRVGECKRLARETRFFALRLQNRGQWTLDNMITSCQEHVRDYDVVHY